MDLAVGYLDGDPIKRELLTVGVHAQRHRGAGAEGRSEEVIRGRAGVEATDRGRLVGEQAMLTDHDVIEERTLSRLSHHHRR